MSNPITQILGTEKVSRERFNQIISESNTAFNNIESKIPTITGISLNTVLTPGVYLFKDCILEVESVSQTVSGMLYVVMYGPSDIYQAIQVLSNGYFTRIYSGSEWTSLTFHPYTLQSDLAVVATSGSYNDLVGKPQDNTFVYTLTHTKSGNVHKLTGLSGVSGIVSCQFKATAGYNAALDTLTVDGVSYTIKLSSGEKAEDNLFVSGAVVPCIVDTAGKTVNFKGAGGQRLPAGTTAIVKIYAPVTDVGTVSETFVVPETGDYRVTVVGKGGNGGDSFYMEGYESISSAGGSAGGTGGWCRSVVKLLKGESVPITVNPSISSFGSYLSATSGENGRKSSGTFASSPLPGGAGGTASGGGEKNVDGAAGGASVLYSGSNYYHNGGNSNPVPQNEDSVYLCNAVSTGGKYETNSYSNRKPLATALQSTKIYRPFGAAGGGSTVLVLQSGQVNNSGAVGCCGAVTIEKVVQ